MHTKLDDDNLLIVTDDYNKNSVVSYLSSLDHLTNSKVMTLTELIENYYFTYDEQALYYLMHNYHIKYDIAKMYIQNMYYVYEPSDNVKINKIYMLKEELIQHDLLIRNRTFSDYLSKQKIVFYNISHIPAIIKRFLPSYEMLNEEENHQKREIWEFSTLTQEVDYIALKIASLIKKGIDINKIYLTNLNDEYRFIIKRVFSYYHLPVSLKEKNYLYSTTIGQEFLKLYESDIQVTLDKLVKIISPEEMDVYNQIVNICNQYAWCDDYLNVQNLIIEKLKKTTLMTQTKTNSIKEIALGTLVAGDEYLFLLGFNQGVVPIIYKDEDYFNDQEKEVLNIETSFTNNIIVKEQVKKYLYHCQNVCISYKCKSLMDTYTISSLNDELKYPVLKPIIDDYTHSHLANKISLGVALDLYHKYGTITPNLQYLYANYEDINYRSYDNRFTGINASNLANYLDHKLLLSYSSLDNYYRCGFRYYIGNILKLNIYEETFMQFIGNLFHYVLSQAFKPNFNFDECFDNYLVKELTPKETFFIKKLKEELRFIVQTIAEHNQHTKLDEELYEEKVYINYEGNVKVTFMGIIDKLKYRLIDNRYIVAIIDYKTGNPNLNLNNVIYGMEMQLPIYIYLAKHHAKFDHIEVAGFYLQKILNNEIVADQKHSYTELKKKNLLLQGYSNANEEILSYFDDSYHDSCVVKSLKTTNKGFYAYSKVISSNYIDKLVALTEQKINEATSDILEAHFMINPKRIGYENKGCEYCRFKDICFVKEKDIVNLKEYKNLEFLED